MTGQIPPIAAVPIDGRNSTTLKGRALFITGASRGIGLAIAVRAAREGANIAIAAKTAEPHAKLPGTIHSAAEAVRAAGGVALPLVMDVRDEGSVRNAVWATVDAFGGIDICVNNASAIALDGTLQTDMKRYDLMHQINARGTFLVTRECIPHLRKSDNPHVLSLSPPLDFRPQWFARYPAYSVAKYNMSLYMMAMAAEFRNDGIAFNGLWPRSTIATSAIKFRLSGDEGMRHSRTPEIVAEAACRIFKRPSRQCTGQFFLDDDVLWGEGVTDFTEYSAEPGAGLHVDLFVDPTAPCPPGVHFVPRPEERARALVSTPPSSADEPDNAIGPLPSDW